MSKIERKYMAHYIDTTFRFTGIGSNISWTPSWYRLGEDLEEYSVEMEPSGDVEKNFLGEDVVILTGYDMKGEVEPFYAYTGDAMFEKLQDIIDNTDINAACLTIALEVKLWDGNGTSYPAVLRPCFVVPTSYGGDTSGYVISFEVRYLNNFTKYGTFKPNKKGSGTFTEN